MKRKAILLAVMGIILVVGTGVSLATVLISDPAGAGGAGSALATNGGPTGDRSVSPGGSDNEIRSSAYWLAASSDEPTEQDARYDREDEEHLQANDDDRYDVGDQGEQDQERDDADTED
jgi:hypothetical protein